MSNRPKAFFHPVLRSTEPDYVDGSKFEVEVRGEILADTSGQVVRLNYKITLSNAKLRDSLIDGLSVLHFEISCPDTLFKLSVNGTALDSFIDLPPGSCRGNLQIKPYLVAIQELDSFAFEGIHGEFAGGGYQVEQGSPLAIGDSLVVPIEFAHQAFNEILHVFLDTGMHKNSYQIGVSGERISVGMGVNAFAAWGQIGSDVKTKPYLFMSVYKDCIVSAISLLIEEDPIGFPWANKFIENLERSGFGVPSSGAEYSEINSLALVLVGGKGMEKVIAHGE